MLFDLHCDTAYEIYKNKQKLLTNTKAIDLEKYSVYSKKAQVFAIWSDKDLTDDECYLSFQHIASEFKAQVEENSDKAAICTSPNELKCALSDNKLAAILSVEDSRLLGKDLSRLSRLYENGVRILTLAWKGKTSVCGGYDTDEGLTPFGFEVLRECENLGIIVDVSHLSDKGFFDVTSKATKPFIASHSNARAICDNPRNITDIQIRTVAASGGICGVNLVANHLSKLFEDNTDIAQNTVLESVCSHIEHYHSISPESICLGLDFDGTAALPGLETVNKAVMIKEALANRGMDKKSIEKIFFDNAYEFFINNLPGSNCVDENK